jgi:hypothetical protein
MLVLFPDKRIKALEEAVAKLKRDMDDRDLDWVDMRSRCKRLLDRTEKAARALQTGVESEPAQPNGGGAETIRVQEGRALTAHQMEVQQKILRRRAGA